MVLRRVVSAPAELALLAHRKKVKKKIEAYEQDTLFIVTSEASLDGGVTDPNEQFFCYLAIKYLTSAVDEDVADVLKDIVARVFCSIISHHFMKLFLHFIHYEVFHSLSGQ